MKRFGSVYIITNNITNKKYIGQTIQSLDSRFKQHIRDGRSGRHMHNSINFYGKENFTIEELAVCFDQKSLDICETFLIEKLNTFSPNGYNLCKGGSQKGEITEETRLKMSLAKKGKTVTRTKKWSSESRLEKSRAQGGRPIIAKSLIDNSERFYNFINEAEKDGFNNSEIYRVLSGKRKHHKNHTFYYANQSGSVESKNSSHAQRIEIETTKVE